MGQNLWENTFSCSICNGPFLLQFLHNIFATTYFSSKVIPIFNQHQQISWNIGILNLGHVNHVSLYFPKYHVSSMDFFCVYRAKQNRRAMIRNQIETLLNIRGKDMPSVEEEFGSGGTIF